MTNDLQFGNGSDSDNAMEAIDFLQQNFDSEDNSQYLLANSTDEFLGEKSKDKVKKMANEVEVMLPILRFLQLLCENHNLDMQVCS